VKLLFDENLSPKLSDLVAAGYPASIHVRTVGLQGAADQHVWDYARTEGFAIASKDNDFRQRSFVFGSPPKVVWLDVGNAGGLLPSPPCSAGRDLVSRCSRAIPRHHCSYFRSHPRAHRP
jgi:predicted nuclease of predicted toxin-antitoxin system